MQRLKPIISMSPDLSIVIVNWNTCDLLRDCLDSLYTNQGHLILEIIVYDNASQDGSVSMVREKFPQVKLLSSSENLGYARANNLAIPHCSSDLVLLLNPDTRVLEGSLEELVQFLQSHPEAGAIGPKIVHPMMRLRVLSCGYQPTLRTTFNQYFFLSSVFPNIAAFRGVNLLMGPHDKVVQSVEWLSGACLLVKKEVIERVGVFSENWFMYAEDMEFCQRILDAGWKLYHIPTSIIEHYFGASTAKNQSVSTMWVRSQRSYFIHRSKPSRLHLFLFDFILSSGLATRSVLYYFRGKLGSRNQRSLWEIEARRFAAYAGAVWRPS